MALPPSVSVSRRRPRRAATSTHLSLIREDGQRRQTEWRIGTKTTGLRGIKVQRLSREYLSTVRPRCQSGLGPTGTPCGVHVTFPFVPSGSPPDRLGRNVVQVRVGQLLQQQLTAALRLSLPVVGTMSAALSSASAPKWPLVRVLMPQPQEALRMIREVIRNDRPGSINGKCATRSCTRYRLFGSVA
jgi:hypothetical protein